MRNHLSIGKLGEDLACRFLEERGFEVIGRNYRKKWGEIDIIVKKNSILHFVEVKSVTREIVPGAISRVTNNIFQPEDNIHPWKIKRLSRAIQSYLLDYNVSDETEWQFDIVAVFLDVDRKTSKIRFTENMPLY